MKKTSLRTRAAPGFSDFQVAGSEEEEEDEAEKDLQVFFSSFLSLFVLFPFLPLSTSLRELSSLPLETTPL